MSNVSSDVVMEDENNSSRSGARSGEIGEGGEIVEGGDYDETLSSSSPTSSQTHLPQTQQQQLERRSSIQHIMNHPHLSQQHKRHSLQILMDGRRRSSFGSTFAEAALNVAAEFALLNNSGTTNSNGSFHNNHSSKGSGNTSRRSSMMSISMDCGEAIDIDSDHNFDDDDDNDDNDDNDNNNNEQMKSKALRRTALRTTVVTTTTNEERSSSSSSSTNNNQNQYNIYNHQQHLQLQHPPTIAYTLHGIPIGNTCRMIAQQPTCSHYKRNCSIISPCCGMVFGCRLCHDECDNQYIPFMKILQDEAKQQQQQQQHQQQSARIIQNEHGEKINNQTEDCNNVNTYKNFNTRKKMDIMDQENDTLDQDDHLQENNMTNDGMQILKSHYGQATTNVVQHQQQDFQIQSSSTSPYATAPISTNHDEKAAVGTTAAAVPSLACNHSTRRSYSRRLSLTSVVSENGGDDVHHDIDRFAIDEIICRKCFTRQSSKR